jgi:histidyl-tRNA synthetase
VAEELRAAGVPAIAELASRSAKAALKRADRLGARLVILIGDDEQAAGEVTLKNLASGEQRRAPRSEVLKNVTGGTTEETA